MAVESKDNYYTKTEADDGFISSNQGSENNGKVLGIDTDGNVIPVDVSGGTPKKPYQRRTFWTQNIDCKNPITDFTIHTLNDLDEIDVHPDKCVLYLPDSYAASGDPTKLILFCKQGASEITSSSDQIVDQCAFFLKLGYAILAVEGIPDEVCEERVVGKRTVGNYMHTQSMVRAYEKVIEEYNIDSKGCYAYGWSQGGHTLQNLLDNTNLPIICAAAQSPVCSMRYHQWDLAASATRGGVSFSKDARLSVARLFDYPTVSTDSELTALEYDASKSVGWDPYVRNADEPYTGFVKSGSLWYFPSGTTVADITMRKRMRCPFKAWVADNDNALGSDVTKTFVKAIKNSGQVAEIKCYSTGAHSIPAAQSTLTTFTEHGVSQNLKPLYLEMAQWFEKYGGYTTAEYSPDPDPSSTLPLTNTAVSVIQSTVGSVNGNSTIRLSSGSLTKANGIFIRNGESITITGLKPTGKKALKVDAAFATSAGPNPDYSLGRPWEYAVGTLSKYNADNYFPLNEDGSNNSVTILNDNGADYYYFFAFASAANLSDTLTPSDYNLTYEIQREYEVLPIENGMTSVTQAGYGCVSSSSNRLTSGSTTSARGIYLENGESMEIIGLAPSGQPALRLDYCYATDDGPQPVDVVATRHPWEYAVGTASNFVSENYFPINTEGNNSATITNSYGQGYYFFFGFAGPNKTETLTPSDYKLLYKRM